MSKTYYLPSDDAGRLVWLNNFATKLSAYASTLGLTPVDLASVTNDTAFLTYCLNAQIQVAAYAQQWTTYKNAARDGTAASLGLAPVAPNFGAAPAAVAPGIIARLKALVARIKTAPGYTPAIGQALQIVGADHTVDVNTLKPALTAALDAGKVIVGWTKQGMDGIELQVDRGSGFVFLAVDTVVPYTDTQLLPAAGQSALWKYKAIYIQADQRVGQWSDVVSLPVAG